MEVLYDVGIESEEGIYTWRFPLKALKWLFDRAPSEPVLVGIIVNAMNQITVDPISDGSVTEIGNFFSEMAQHWFNSQVLDAADLQPKFEGGIHIQAVVVMAVIPDNIPLTWDNQYSYFRDCRHRETLKARWNTIRAEYLAQNPHMAGPVAQARHIYEIRRQMAHELRCSYSHSSPSLSANSHLAGVDKEIFHLVETPPRISEEYRPVIFCPPWKMPFMRTPVMELPMLPRFRQQRAIPASAPRSQTLAELHNQLWSVRWLPQDPASYFDVENHIPGAESPAHSYIESDVATAGSGRSAV